MMHQQQPMASIWPERSRDRRRRASGLQQHDLVRRSIPKACGSIRTAATNRPPRLSRKPSPAILARPDAYYNLASSLHKNGKLNNRPADLQQAEQLYNQCLDYDPNHAECYRGLAVLFAETDRQDASYRLLEGWSSRSPQLPDPRIELARLYEESNNMPQAAAQVGRSHHDRSPQQPGTHGARSIAGIERATPAGTRQLPAVARHQPLPARHRSAGRLAAGRARGNGSCGHTTRRHAHCAAVAIVGAVLMTNGEIPSHEINAELSSLEFELLSCFVIRHLQVSPTRRTFPSEHPELHLRGPVFGAF